jgi:hypothetical protein
MTTRLFIFSLLLIYPCVLFSQITGYDHEQIKHQIKTLSSEEMEGRRAGSAGAELAQAFIIEALKSMEIAPLGKEYLQPFEIKDSNKRQDSITFQTITANNITGFIDNRKEKNIVIGAHYDHLGRGFHPSSRSIAENPLHHGADDNASGVVAAMHIAKQLQQNKTTEAFNYIIVFFSAEEIGLLGSKAWIQAWGDQLDIAAMINLDMVGRMQDRKVQLYGVGTSPSWINFQQTLTNSINWEIDSSGMGPSDHASFYLDSIPAIHFFTGQHEDYHKESDTHEKINFDGLIDLKDAIYESLMLLNEKEAFQFTATVNKNTKNRPKLRVSMGIMPSYVSNEKGLAIDGVIDGKPAQRALLKKGDIIIQIEDLQINDIYDYMDALANYDVGDEVTVKIIRLGETQKLKLKF